MLSPSEPRHCWPRIGNLKCAAKILLQSPYAQSWHLLRDLPAGEVDNFTVTFRDITAELSAKQQAQIAPLPQPNTREFFFTKKWAITGREAAEQQERDEATARRRRSMEAYTA
jgi:hypothetical protein